MVNAHCADAMVCISNCDKITPGMLMAAMRLNIPAVFVSGGPMEAGKVDAARASCRRSTWSTPWSRRPTTRYRDEEVATIERSACPTCGSCSGMFTANSMNCLTEALGLSLPGNGSMLATHADRKRLFVEAGRLIVDLARRYYEQDDASRAAAHRSPPRRPSRTPWRSTSPWAARPTRCCTCWPPPTRAASTSPWTTSTALSRKVPCLCKVAPAKSDVHMEDVHRAGGIMAILGELDRAGLINRDRADRACARRWATRSTAGTSAAPIPTACATSSWPRPAACAPRRRFSQANRWAELDLDREERRHPLGRARLLQGRRARRALRQHRARRLHREDGGRRRVDPEVHRPGARLREPGRGGQGDPGQRGQGRRRRGHPLRGPARRAGHAGNALSDQLPEIEGPRQGLRAGHRRPLLRRHLGPVDRPRLARKPPRAARSALVREGDTIEIDIPNRTINLAVADDELAAPPRASRTRRAGSRPRRASAR